MKKFLVILSVILVSSVSAHQFEWNYTFNKINLISVPTAAGFGYLGYKNYSTVRAYSDQEILQTQNSQKLSHYRFSEPLDDFGTYAAYSAAGLSVIASAPMLGWNSKKILTAGYMYMHMLVLERGMAGIVKNVSRVPRPYVFDPSVPLSYKRDKQKDAYMSFYSAHTSFAFANAFFWSDMINYSYLNRKWKMYGKAFLYGSATLVGVTRYFSGQHFAQDIVVGAGVGVIIAYFTLKIHDMYDMEPFNKKYNSSLTISPTSTGVYLALSF